MRRTFAAGFLAMLAAGCGDGFSGDAKAVNDLCVRNGGTAAYCECTTKTLQGKLSPEAFAQIAKGAPAPAEMQATLAVIGEADKVCAGK